MAEAVDSGQAEGQSLKKGEGSGGEVDAPPSKEGDTATTEPAPPVVHAYAFDPFDAHSRPGGMGGYCPTGRRAVLMRLTKDILTTYERCNPGHRFRFKVFRRVLTNPKDGQLNDGLDNADANLICSVGDALGAAGSGGGGVAYTIVDLLGEGTFGQVFKCTGPDNTSVAVKVVKSKPSYFRQAQLEVAVLRMLNDKHDPHDGKHIVRLLNHFSHKGHLCLVFELLDMNLYELLKQNQFRGLPLALIRQFVGQILTAMMVLEEAGIIHCDLKPENILMVGGVAKVKASQSNDGKKKPLINQVKVIDFGSACFEGRTMYTYIQSRFYRSPEVLLGLLYDTSIDMWSLGCICAEMFLGLPIFPGVSEHNQLARIVEMLGPPPDFMLEYGSNTAKYFKRRVPKPPPGVLREPADGADPLDDHDPALEPRARGKAAPPGVSGAVSHNGSWVLKTAEEYAADTKTPVVNSKKYFKHKRLQDIIRSYPYGRKMTPEETEREDAERRSFLGYVLGLLELNPFKRWTARQAAEHPFACGGPPEEHFEPSDVVAVRDRRLQCMLTALQKAGNASESTLDPYLVAAAYASGRPPPPSCPAPPPPSPSARRRRPCPPRTSPSFGRSSAGSRRTRPCRSGVSTDKTPSRAATTPRALRGPRRCACQHSVGRGGARGGARVDPTRP